MVRVRYVEPDEHFDGFAREHVRRLIRTATVISGDRHLGEDLAQEVLIKAMRHWDRLRQLDAPEAYLRRMLVNEFLSDRRRRRATLMADVPDTATDVAAGDQLDDRAALQDEIRRLPRHQQVALALRYFADLSDQDIAETMGCSTGTVRGYVSRALSTLRVQSAGTLAPDHAPHHGGTQ